MIEHPGTQRVHDSFNLALSILLFEVFSADYVNLFFKKNVVQIFASHHCTGKRMP